MIETQTSERANPLFKTLLEQPVSVLSPEPQAGPEGFPYLLVSTDKKENDSFVNVANWCVSRGIGIVVNPNENGAEYIFTFGMLWNFLLRNEFITEAPEQKSGNLNITHGQQFLAGAPSEDYWPSAIRTIFKEFLVQQGIFDARVVILFESEGAPANFCFSQESLGNPPQKEWAGILEAFSWFFPRHYSLSIISEKNFNTSFTRI